MFAKLWKFNTKRKFNSIINIYLMFILCLRLELLKLILNFYSLGVTIFLFNFLEIILLFTYFLEFTQFFSILLPTRITKLKNLKPKKNMLIGEWVLIQLFKFFTKLCYFYFSKENEGKTYSYIMKRIYIL